MHKVSRPLGLIWTDLCRESFFQLGLVIKLFLVFFLLPDIQTEWFVPFITSWLESPSILPWSGHLNSGGDAIAFPYGIIMFVAYLPLVFFGWALDSIFEIYYFSGVGFRITLLLFDLLLLILILKIFEDYWRKVIVFYWFSPLAIFITYWHGQIDIIPVALFFLSLVLLKNGNFRVSGLLLACAIAAKHSMLIGAPFILIYIWTHNGIHKEFQKYLVFFIGSLIILEGPFLLADSFRLMVLENPELDKLYWLSINMSEGVSIYLILLVYLLLLYFFWRIKRVNFDLLVAALGVSFAIVILMTPSPPGWYLWLVPIFTIHQSRYGEGAVLLLGSFSILFILYHLFYTSGATFFMFDLDFSIFEFQELILFKSVHYSLLVSFGLLIAIQLLRQGVRENDYYRLGNRPVSLGIAGDSGVGKTTFSNSFSAIFGKNSIVAVSGDDYHIWDRSSPMWKTITHLNPKANKLFQLVQDVRSLMNGNSIYARSYDHSSGNFTTNKKSSSKDVILVEGLHVLYPNQLIEELDVRVFIEMDESLRTFLRVKRDVSDRGHYEKKVRNEIDRRKADSKKYIQPQGSRSDIVFKLMPINIELVDKDYSIDSNLKIKITIKNGVYYDELVRVLIGVCGLQVNIDSIDEKGEVVLEVSGDLASEDASLAVGILIPHMKELFYFSAKFEAGTLGIMQILTLLELDEALKRRKN
ncbi:hypothetical protein N9M18_02295 [Candidatus Pseudothioglobus singularis]|nr:hypothetical protein [Candidatus Pseudothioglobus singularis]